MIEDLKKNIDAEIGILREISIYFAHAEDASGSHRTLLLTAIETLQKKMAIVNNALPEIIKNIAPSEPLVPQKKPETMERLQIVNHSGVSAEVTLNKKDKKDFMQAHSISSDILKRLKKEKKDIFEEKAEYKGARGYIKFSNRFFLSTAQKLTTKSYMTPLADNIRKANLDILFSAYIAMIIMSAVLSFVAGILIAIFFMFFNVGLTFPFISTYAGSILSRLLIVVWIPIVLPPLTALALYYYPSTERDSIAKRIEQELPFAVIHMSAISGSGIEPSEIFRIIGLSHEYPYLRREIRKVINEINLYGYDLVTALNYVSKNTPSNRLSELFAGLSTTISSGGDLSDFFEKRAETLLITYRLEREKFTKVAETFMDIYISVVIAAPLILMLLLVMMQVSNINLGFTSQQMGLLIILLIAVLNSFFIGFLHVKQPSY